jgi:hypothetical protein
MESDAEKEKVVNTRNDHSAESENLTIHPTDSLGYSNSKEEKIVAEEAVLDEVPTSGTIETAETETPSQQIEKTSLPEKEEPETEIKQKTEPLTWVSLLLLAGIGISAGLIAIYSSFLYLGASIFLTGLALVFFVLITISFIRTRKYPERYKNKWLTTLLFYIGVFSLIIGAMYITVAYSLDSMGPIM